MIKTNNRPNCLGSLTAEHDHSMLDSSFLETPDYRTLIESNDKIIVVGRRGTGKSALTYRLEKDWSKNTQIKNYVFKFAPAEDQVIGLKPLLAKFNGEYKLIRAAVKIAWEFSMLMEVVNNLSRHYKYQKCRNSEKASAILKEFYESNKNIAFHLRKVISISLKNKDSPEDAIADMTDTLGLNILRETVSEFLENSSIHIKILIDCLDEGYEPDVQGVSYTSGILQATLSVNNYFEKIRPVVFIRDNMYRAVAIKDPDYTRNIEGSALRLHWGEQELLYMTAARLKIVFGLEVEKDIKAWNLCTVGGISEKAGFKKCLRLTLYRPRDLIALLNQSFYSASRRESSRISEDDVLETAKDISQARLDDLTKEYNKIFPSLNEVISVFKGYKSKFSLQEISDRLQNFIDSSDATEDWKRDMAFYETSEELVVSLHSIGFLGVRDKASDVYSFSHDGKNIGLDLGPESILHIHPCYQIALNLTEAGASESEAEEIHDDYEIHISSMSREQRNKKVGQLISRLHDMASGSEDAARFEEWCHDAISMIFAAELQNIRLKPNGYSAQRRDIVGTISASKGVWNRINQDYGTRSVVFEIKNFSVLEPDHFRQLAAYLTDIYGRLGFIIYRSEQKEPSSDNELVWIREIYWKGGNKLIVLLSYKYLITFLEKIRNPQKHDAVNDILERMLDTYHDLYLNERAARRKRGKK